MSNDNNKNTSMINDENLIPSEVLASGKQISFPDFNIYKIGSFCGKYVDIPGGSTENKTAIQFQSQNGDNQKFLIFTLDDGNSVIAAKHSGKVMDVYYNSSGNRIIQFDFHNSNNQKFFISTNGTIAAKQDGHVWDVYNASTQDGATILSFKYIEAKNQKFTLNKSGSVSITKPAIGTLPPAPDFKTDDLNEQLPDQTNPVNTHVTYLPYFMVKDPYYNAQQQMKNSPYYTLVRRQYWEKKTQRILAPSDAYEYSETIGVSRTDQTSMTDTTEISIGADLGFVFKGFSAGLSTTVTRTLSVTKSTSNTESSESTRKLSYKNEFRHTIAYAKYMLINEYYVTRANGEKITMGDSTYWRVPNPEQTVARIIPRG
ncbi:TPA: RICIN domain-containing protein [Bacillus cereus]|nr:RICIN domain-containing protein [Bacillus cereus]